jgi:hypothetical protein
MAQIDSAAGTAVTVREGESTFISRPRKYGSFCIVFNNSDRAVIVSAGVSGP